jgi:hypothetical protein
VYHGVTYAGYVGLLTGMKPGAFAVSVDERDTNGTIIDNALEALLLGGRSIGMTLRNLLGSDVDFEVSTLGALPKQAR